MRSWTDARYKKRPAFRCIKQRSGNNQETFDWRITSAGSVDNFTAPNRRSPEVTGSAGFGYKNVLAALECETRDVSGKR